jgi:hypothetical protein
MEKINYSDILKKSWRITRRNKFLWWFGFFLTLGGGGGFNFNLPFGSGTSGKQEKIAVAIQDFIARYWQWIVSGVIFLLVVFLALLIMRIISQAGLIKAANIIDLGKLTTFKESFFEGRKYFWKVFLLGLLVTIFVSGVIIVLFTPVVFLAFFRSYTLAVILGVLAFIITLVLAIVTSYVKKYAAIYLVLSNLSIRDSLENAYLLFRKNIMASIIFSLLLLVAGIIVGLGILIFLFTLAIIFIIPGIISYLLLQGAGVTTIAILGFLLAIVFVIFIQSIFHTFMQTSWVLFFKEIASVKIEEAVVEKEVAKIPEKILDAG